MGGDIMLSPRAHVGDIMLSPREHIGDMMLSPQELPNTGEFFPEDVRYENHNSHSGPAVPESCSHTHDVLTTPRGRSYIPEKSHSPEKKEKSKSPALLQKAKTCPLPSVPQIDMMEEREDALSSNHKDTYRSPRSIRRALKEQKESAGENENTFTTSTTEDPQ